MTDQQSKAERFRALHRPGQPVILFNVWDPGSTKAVGKAGAEAIATGSWAVAAANGFADGEKLPLSLAIENLTRIVAATALPVSVDLESGYGADPDEVGATIRRTIDAGAVGCNIEDSDPASRALRPIADQVERIRQGRRIADRSGVAYFINARTDVFFQKPPPEHDEAMLAAAIERGRAYAEAGADGLFAPGLVDPHLIARLAEASRLPLNIMIGGNSPDFDVLAGAGVARVSHGPQPYLAAMKFLEDAARSALGRGRTADR